MGINLQRLTHEIQEMQQLHKMPESRESVVSRSVVTAIDMNTLNMTEIYK